MLELTADGIPKWDGAAEEFDKYREEALKYQETLEWHKQYLAGPRLARALSGAAAVAIRHQPAGWLSNPKGVAVLLQHLEQHLRRPSLPDAGHMISRFFFGLKRRRGETMGAWILRHQETYEDAGRALRRATKEYGQGNTPSVKTMVEEVLEWNPDDGDNSSDKTSWDSSGWYASSWYQGSWWQQSEKWQHGERTGSADKIDFLPDFLVAWLLLSRSSLDQGEKGNALAAIGTHFSKKQVELILRAQWSDEELRKRDATRGNHGFFQEGEVADEDDVFYQGDVEPDDFNMWEPDDREAFIAAQVEIEDAMAAVEAQKRTLKEARKKQHDVKMRRKFFRPHSGGSNNVKCFKCGGPHYTNKCPDRSDSRLPVKKIEDSHFSWWAAGTNDESDIPIDNQEADAYMVIRHADAIQAGKAIIDGGATATLGSVGAMEVLAQRNREVHGDDKMTIDREQRPLFHFGNGASQRCLSTVQLGVQADEKQGELTVHVHEAKSVPILIGIQALRKMGAIIDFKHDVAVFSSLNPCKLVKLEQSVTGHQLLPLVGDIMKQSTELSRPIRSLTEFE